MHPTQTETPQYTSRRERHEAEAATTAEHSLTRRELRAVERANVYLEGLRIMNATNSTNHEASQSAPSTVGPDLTIQKGLITAYQNRIDGKDWNTIRYLDQLWHDTQPTEEEAEEELATYAENTPKERGIKLGQFISKRIFGARQNWLNKDTLRVKREHMADMQHSQAKARHNFGKAA